ncbi:hypothetical protein [Nocardioides plantarum]|uniref:Secreted protein n=1 Tax=Nocardioides plantarum TaxID=29299 RepID=A0ABV5KAS6_9ACTN|nr:hypothetical protein [Nocardioides plantarum]
MNRSTTRILPVLALSAVVIGTATAGSAVAAGLVTGAQIKNSTITGIDVKNGSLTGSDVKDGSLAGKDVKNGSLGEGELSPGTRKKLNEPAVQGYQVVTQTVSVPTDGQASVFVFCPAGKVALGGGSSWAESALEVDAVVNESSPGKAVGEFFAPLEAGDRADAWKVTGQHHGLDAQDLTGYVICVSPS